jgi:hypothetical protein
LPLGGQFWPAVDTWICAQDGLAGATASWVLNDDVTGYLATEVY